MGMARVVVADDNGKFVRTVRAGVGEFVDLRVVSNGAALLELVGLWEPQVVVLDMLLADIDGFTLLDRLACPCTADARPPAVLCVTSGRGAGIRSCDLRGWPVGTLTRSASPSQIRTSVLRALAAHKDPLPHRIS